MCSFGSERELADAACSDEWGLIAMSEDDDIVQKLERSIDFWVEDRTDYPPAIRGVIAHSSDLRDEVREAVQKQGSDPKNPAVRLNRVLWFDDKNEKLDEACSESTRAFKAYASNEFGLVSWKDDNNPLIETPTRHRLIVSDEFAQENYRKEYGGALILEDSDSAIDVEGKEEDEFVPQWSWKRKITQSLKPWRVKEDGVIKAARRPDDLMRTLNTLFSITKHGWLLVDLIKLKKRRGSMMTYARTFEYQKAEDQRFEFKLQLIGTAIEYHRRLAKLLANIACLYLEIDETGEAWVSKVSLFEDDPTENVVVIPVPARVVNENGKPSQIVLDTSGKYFQSKIKPLIKVGEKKSTKLDIRKSATADKQYRFRLKLAMEGPLLVASSGNAMIFQLDDMLKRFRDTTLAGLEKLKADTDDS